MSLEHETSTTPGIKGFGRGKIQKNGEILVENAGREKATHKIFFPENFASEQNLSLEVSVIGPNHVICKVINQDGQDGKNQWLAFGPICLQDWRGFRFFHFSRAVNYPELSHWGGHVQVVRLETEERVKQYLSVANACGYTRGFERNSLLI